MQEIHNLYEPTGRAIGVKVGGAYILQTKRILLYASLVRYSVLSDPANETARLTMMSLNNFINCFVNRLLNNLNNFFLNKSP